MSVDERSRSGRVWGSNAFDVEHPSTIGGGVDCRFDAKHFAEAIGLKNLFGGPSGDLATMVKHGNLIGVAECEVEIVEDDDHGMASFCPTPGEREGEVLVSEIEVVDWFIEEKVSLGLSFGTVNLREDSCELDALFFATTEGREGTRGEGGEIQFGDDCFDNLIILFAFDAFVVRGAAHRDDFSHREGEIKAGRLGEQGSAGGQFFGGPATERLVFEGDASGGGFEFA